MPTVNVIKSINTMKLCRTSGCCHGKRVGQKILLKRNTFTARTLGKIKQNNTYMIRQSACDRKYSTLDRDSHIFIITRRHSSNTIITCSFRKQVYIKPLSVWNYMGNLDYLLEVVAHSNLPGKFHNTV